MIDFYNYSIIIQCISLVIFWIIPITFYKDNLENLIPPLTTINNRIPDFVVYWSYLFTVILFILYVIWNDYKLKPDFQFLILIIIIVLQVISYIKLITWWKSVLNKKFDWKDF